MVADGKIRLFLAIVVSFGTEFFCWYKYGSMDVETNQVQNGSATTSSEKASVSCARYSLKDRSNLGVSVACNHKLRRWVGVLAASASTRHETLRAVVEEHLWLDQVKASVEFDASPAWNSVLCKFC